MSERGRRRGTVLVGFSLLEGMMHFPEGHHIIDLRCNTFRNEFEILVEGPTLPETLEGAMTQRLQYIVTITETEATKTFEGKFAV